MFKSILDKMTEKDRKIKELKDALIHVVSVVESRGRVSDYEANLEWEPPVYLRNGEYTIDKRLEDIRRNVLHIRKAAAEAKQVLYPCEWELDKYKDIP